MQHESKIKRGNHINEGQQRKFKAEQEAKFMSRAHGGPETKPERTSVIWYPLLKFTSLGNHLYLFKHVFLSEYLCLCLMKPYRCLFLTDKVEFSKPYLLSEWQNWQHANRNKTCWTEIPENQSRQKGCKKPNLIVSGIKHWFFMYITCQNTMR